MNALGQAARDLLKVLEHTGARPVKVGSVLEHDEDIGVAKHGLCAYSLDVRRGEQGGHDWICYLVLDNVGRLARPWGVDNHLHVRDVGQGIERDATQRPDSCQHEQERAGENQKTIASAPVNPAGNHLHPPFCNHRQLLAHERLTVLLSGDADLPCPARL